MGEESLEIFSTRIKDLRNRLNLTQKDFASSINITASALSAYEKNMANPSLGVAIKISEKYNVSIDWLCGKDVTESENLITYGDLLKNILAILCNNTLTVFANFNKGKAITDSNISSAISGFIEMDIYLSDTENGYRTIAFLDEWYAMQKLVDDGVVGPDVLDAWVEKNIKELSKYTLEPLEEF